MLTIKTLPTEERAALQEAERALLQFRDGVMKIQATIAPLLPPPPPR